MNRKKLSKKELFKRNIPLALMSLPAVVILFLFSYLPRFGIILAFKDFNYPEGILGSPWNGLENFKYIFSSGEIWTAIRNTVGYHYANMVTTTISSVALALMLYAVNKKAAKKYQQIITMPYLVSTSAITAMVYVFLRYDGGIVNTVREMLGKEAVGWYVTPDIWPGLLIFIMAWFGVGIKTIYYYSVFMGIDHSLFEAIDVDGGNWKHKVRHIMLPEIVPILCLFTITDAGSMLASSLAFYLNIPMDNTALYEVTEVLATYEYHGLQMGNISTTVALGLFVGCVQLLAVQLTNSIVKKISPDNSMY